MVKDYYREPHSSKIFKEIVERNIIMTMNSSSSLRLLSVSIKNLLVVKEALFNFNSEHGLSIEAKVEVAEDYRITLVVTENEKSFSYICSMLETTEK